MRKLINIGALLLSFAAANATGRTKESIHLVYVPQADGNYRLYIFGPDELQCGIGGQKEEKALHVIEPKDAYSPLVVECRAREKEDK